MEGIGYVSEPYGGSSMLARWSRMVCLPNVNITNSIELHSKDVI